MVKALQRDIPPVALGYAWRHGATQSQKAPLGLALAWWLAQLDSAATRTALLERHAGMRQVVD